MGILKRSLNWCLLLAALGVLNAGCAPLLIGVGIKAGTDEKATLEQASATNKTRLKDLAYGVSKKYVKDAMGARPIRAFVGEEKVELSNPYREKAIVVNGQTYTVLYFLTDANNDRLIQNNELTPVVFENDQLIGWGWSFVNELKYR